MRKRKFGKYFIHNRHKRKESNGKRRETMKIRAKPQWITTLFLYNEIKNINNGSTYGYDS